MHINKIYLYIILLFVILGSGLIYFINNKDKNYNQIESGPKVEVKVEKKLGEKNIIGTSTESRSIEAYTFNPNTKDNSTGTKSILIVGGMHGGYEWNSSLLAYELIDHFKKSQNKTLENVSLSIIPSLNPDALYSVTQKNGAFKKEDVLSGDLSAYRFNKNKVDLNRNFDCNWQKESTWKNKVVSAGTKAFSEKESQILQDYIYKIKPLAVIFLHSSAGAVYASECNDGVLPITKNIMNVYAKSSGYKSVEKFDAYKVTGDAESWLASIDIPAITVELSTHEDTELEKNIAGINNVIKYFSK